VRDLVEAVVRVLEAPIRLVSGRGVECRRCAAESYACGRRRSDSERFSEHPREQAHNADLRNYRVSFDKLVHRTGFRARYALRDGVDEIREALSQGMIVDYTDLRYHNQRFLLAAGARRTRTKWTRW